MDFQKIIEQFKDTEGIIFYELVSEKHTNFDQIIYTINTNKGTFYVFEVDYIGNFDYYVIEPIKKEIGEFKKIYELKEKKEFEDTKPNKSVDTYFRPKDWDKSSLYANDKFGSQPYYFNFLVKK